MSHNTIIKNTFIMNHSDPFSEKDLYEKEGELKKAFVRTSCRVCKSAVPKALVKEVLAARKEIDQKIHTLSLKKGALSQECNRKALAAAAKKYNRVIVKNGQSELIPIGFFALATSRLRRLPVSVKKVADFAAKDAVEKLYDDYLKNNVLKAEAALKASQKEPASPKACPKMGEKVLPSRIQEEGVSPIKKEEPSFQSTEAPSSSKAFEAKTDSKTRPEVKRREKKENVRKRQKSPKAKRSFWKRFANFFKSAFTKIVQLFKGKKKS